MTWLSPSLGDCAVSSHLTESFAVLSYGARTQSVTHAAWRRHPNDGANMKFSTRGNLRALHFAATATGAILAHGESRAETADAALAGRQRERRRPPGRGRSRRLDHRRCGRGGDGSAPDRDARKGPDDRSGGDDRWTLQQLGVTDFTELLRFTPNVTYGGNGPGQGNIFMRGLSAGAVGNQSSATIASFPNVALYLDDQSMQFPSRNADIYLVDMERVEILEGPQGTLFGGGAEAGAVRYITNKPKLGVFEGDAEASYGFTEGGGRQRQPERRGQYPDRQRQAGRPHRGLWRAPGRLHRQRRQQLHPVRPGPGQLLSRRQAERRRHLPGRQGGRARRLHPAGRPGLQQQGGRREGLQSGGLQGRAAVRALGRGPRLGRADHRKPDGHERQGHRCAVSGGLRLPAAEAAADHRLRALLRQRPAGKHLLDRQRQARPAEGRLHRRLFGAEHQPAGRLHQLLPHRRRHRVSVHRSRQLLGQRRPDDLLFAARLLERQGQEHPPEQ